MDGEPIDLVRAADRSVPDVAQTPGMRREQAFAHAGKWAGFVWIEPGTQSGWHHHGDHDSYVYVIDGALRFDFGPGGSQTVEAGPGDFVHIPPRRIQREQNPSDRPGETVVFRSGEGQVTVNVDGPEG